MREVAGPNPGLAAAEADIDGDLDLAALHMGDHRRLVVAGDDAAVARHPGAADGDAQLVAVGRLAGLADRHDDAAPIGVLAGDRGLHQRRIGDGHGDAVGRPGADRAGDVDLDQFLRALAVARDHAAPGPAAPRPAPGQSPSARAPPSAGTRGCFAWPVAKSSTVSLVEVSLSTVMQLKVSPTPSTAAPAAPRPGSSRRWRRSSASSPCRARSCRCPWRCRRWSPWPRRSTAVRDRGLGEGVGGHDAAGGLGPARRRQRRMQPAAAPRSASHAAGSRRSRRSRRGTPRPACSRRGRAAACGRRLGRLPPALPVKTLALPALTTRAARLAALQRLRGTNRPARRGICCG